MMEINNETFGVCSKIALCKIFNLDYNEDRYNSRINEKVVALFEDVFSINTEIKALNLKIFLDNSFDYNSDIIARSPHNFTNKSEETISIWTFKSNDPKVCPKVVGQPGIDKANKLFGHLIKSHIDKITFKDLVISKPEELLNIYIDYLFLSDISIFIYLKSGCLDTWNPYNYVVKIYHKADLNEIEFDKTQLSFTKNRSEWNESNTIKQNGISIGEFQVHSGESRFVKFRFFLKNLFPLLEKQKSNNETLGVTSEYVICKLFNLSYSKNINLVERSDSRLIKAITPTIQKAFIELPIPIKYSGAEVGLRKGSKSSSDFILTGNRTLSLKTNFKKTNKVCPPEIGQPSFKTFDFYFGKTSNYLPPIDEKKFKEFVINNPDFLFKEYAIRLFDCDDLLWLFGINSDLSNFDYRIVRDGAKTVDSIRVKNKDFTFTKNLKTWNESNTLKYNNKTIGEFQVHSMRKSLKFRFHFFNLIETFFHNQ